jgi:hypothetical protein
VLRRGEVLTRSQLLARCGTTKKTLRKWIDAGLQPLATSTKDDLFLTDEVIEVWINLRLVTPPPPPPLSSHN